MQLAPAAPASVAGVSPVTGRPFASAQTQIAQAAQGGPSGFLANLGKDLVGVATGLPSSLALAGKNLGAVTGLNLLLPGAPTAHEVVSEDVEVGRAVRRDYSERYGPALNALLQGDPVGAGRALATSIHEHPGLFALDVGSVGSGAGAAVRVGGKLAARVAPEAALGRVGARLADTRITPGGARYREPKTYTSRLAEDTTHEAVATISRKRRPYSRNPITRAVVQKPAARLASRIERHVEDIAGDQPAGARALLRPLTEQGRFERAARRTAQDVRLAGEDRLSAELARIGTAYQRTVRTLKPIKGKGQVVEHLQVVPHEADVVHLHVRGLLDQPGMSPVQARDTLVATMRSNLDAAAARGERTKAASENIARFEAIPEHYLSLETAPPHVRTAVEEARSLIDESQRRAVESGMVAPETARASAERAVNILLGGSRYDPRVLNWTPRAQEAASRALAADRRLQDLRRGRVAPGSVATPMEAQRAAAAGASAAGERAARDVALERAGRRPLRMPTRWEAAAEQTSNGLRRLLGQRDVSPGQAKRATQMLAHVERNARTPAQHGRVAALRQMAHLIEEHSGHRIVDPADVLRGTPRVGLRTLGRHYARTERAQQVARAMSDAPLRRAIRESSAERRIARSQLRTELDPGGFTPPRPGFTAGPEARYLPDVPASKIGPVGGGKSTGRFTKERVRQSHGTLISRGNVVTSPNLPLFAARRVLASEQLSENVANLIGRTAYRHGGQIARGPKALSLLRSDPQRVHLVSVKSVQHALAELDNVPEGAGVERATLDRLFAQPDEATVQARPNDFIAIPKSAMDEWRVAMQSPDAALRKYDTVLSAWKAGILAFTPRFYLNNLVGGALLYGLAAGPDIRALFQAARKDSAFRAEGVIPERVAGSTIAREAGSRALEVQEGHFARAKKWADRGFEFNQRLESWWRRALYIHKAKGVLRDEGGKFRHLTQEEVADAVAKMPPELVEESIRTVEQFLGDYRRFNRAERDYVKRAVPFYSWLRHISTLTVTLPIRSPLRAQALHLLSEANQVENPGDFMRPLYNRGRINLPGGLALRTTGINPFSTIVEPAAALTGEGSKATGLARALTSGGAGPAAQVFIGEVTGRDPFTGRDYSAPPGYQGSVSSYGQDAQRTNPVTGLAETVHPSPGFGEQLLRQVPFVGPARQLLAGSQSPYDVTSTWDLLMHRLGGGPASADLFHPAPMQGRATAPLPYVSTIAGLLGAPIQRVDPAAEQAAYDQAYVRSILAYVNTIKQRGKLSARVPG